MSANSHVITVLSSMLAPVHRQRYSEVNDAHTHAHTHRTLYFCMTSLLNPYLKHGAAVEFDVIGNTIT